MNESIHGERTASEPQDRVTELFEQQTQVDPSMTATTPLPSVRPNRGYSESFQLKETPLVVLKAERAEGDIRHDDPRN